MVSRQHHYNIKSAIEEDGLEGLHEKSRKSSRLRNRVAPEIEQKVLDYSLEFPTQGQKRVANELQKQGIQISDGGIRSIWLRHNLLIANLRLKRLEYIWIVVPIPASTLVCIPENSFGPLFLVRNIIPIFISS